MPSYTSALDKYMLSSFVLVSVSVTKEAEMNKTLSPFLEKLQLGGKMGMCKQIMKLRGHEL